jgi:hypothetical protein
MSITIKQAYEQGSLRLVFGCTSQACMMHPDWGWIGGHESKIDIEAAMKRWGEGRRLDEISARCSRCGSRAFVHVTVEPPGRTGKRGRH